jgi:dienelactone hydrolase
VSRPYRMLGLVWIVTALTHLPGAAQDPVPISGTIEFKSPGDESKIPELYRLDKHEFSYHVVHEREMPGCGVDVFRLDFPSPVKSPTPENNTVWAEYYRPRGPGPFAATIVLDITAGDQTLSRTIGTVLAENKIAALFVQMAYYGPRRPAGSRLRLLSPDFKQSMDAVRQSVLDIRRAGAWLESQPEVDHTKIGILGTSLGSLVGTLAAEMEPRFAKVVILLGGGDLVDAYYDHPRAWLMRQIYEACGGTKEKVRRFIAPVDPVTCADRLKDRAVLMIAAKRDQIIPACATLALWNAAGQPRIIWYDCTHYGAALYFAAIMREVTAFLRS